MTPDEFIKSLANPANLYFITGSDSTLVNRCLEKAGQIVNPKFADFNRQTFNSADTPLSQALSEANTMPFFSPPKVVIVKGLNSLDQDSQAAALKYLESPNPQTVLIIVAEKPDSRLKFFKTLKEKAAEVICQPPKGAALTAWVRDEFLNRGFKINSDSVKLLIERAGGDTGLLRAEIEKLSLYAHGREQIEAADIKTVTSLAPGGNIFQLGDALGAGRSREALSILTELLGQDHHLPILIMIIRHFRLLLKAKAWLWENGKLVDNSAAARAIGVPPFVASKYLNQAKNLSWPALKESLNLLERAHRLLVTQPIAPNLLMENLAINLSRI